MELNWTKSLEELNKQLSEMPNIMELSLHNITLSEMKVELLPNLLTLKLINCTVDVDVYNFMEQFDKLMDIELINCTIWIAHNKRSLIIKKCIMSGNYGLEYGQDMKQTKRLLIKYCSNMACLMKDIKVSKELMISNVNARDLVQLPLKHLSECVLLNVFGADTKEIGKVIENLPKKFYIHMDKYTVYSQDNSFALVDIKLGATPERSISMDRGIVRVTSKSNNNLDMGQMIPLLLSS